MEKKSQIARFQSGHALSAENNGRKYGSGKCLRNQQRKDFDRYYITDNSKNFPQKSKTFADKRPKCRSYLYGSTSEEIVEDTDVYSCLAKKPQKVNLNHLLSFTYAPRSSANRFTDGQREKSSRVRFNKEQFVQANCQFLVKDGVDYTVHSTDPDTLVDWQLIEQIIVLTTELPSCPICLYPPKPAKITRCGHIYCWPCIIHYLSLEERPWRKCPICYEAVHLEHLKSVKTRSVQEFHAGDSITMRLMRKERGTTNIEPVSTKDTPGNTATDPTELDSEITRDSKSDDQHEVGDPVNVSELHDLVGRDQSKYMKLLPVASAHVLDIVRREKVHLQQLLKQHPEDSEICFIESALTLLQGRESALVASLKTQDCVSPKLAEENKASTADSRKWLFFYQASDGQQIFLDSLNARCLNAEYGCLEHAPTTLTAEIVDVQYHVMTKDMRRFKYLDHLPLTCEFRTVELRLMSPTISPHTLKIFHGELEKRRRQRNKKLHEENKHTRRVQLDEERKQGIFPPMTISIDNRQHFPEYGLSPPLAVPEQNSSHSTPFGSPGLDTLDRQSVHSDSSAASLPRSRSFAETVKEGRPEFSEWPTLACASNEACVRDTDDGGQELSTTYQYMFAEAVQKAFDDFNLDDEDNFEDKRKKKKKRVKNKVLFTTSVNRSFGY